MRPENTRVWRKGMRHQLRQRPIRDFPSDVATLAGIEKRWLEREADAENETQPADAETS